MKLIAKLKYLIYHLIHLRTGEFMEFVNFLHRFDDLNIYYIGGPDKLLQVSGLINDYHWHKFANQKTSRFFQMMEVVYGKCGNQLTERNICIQLPSDEFTRKEIEYLKRFILALPSKSTNFINVDAFSLNVAEPVSKYFHRVEGKMCVYAFK